MCSIWFVALMATAVFTTIGSSSAWAISAGGTAPGGPLSGSIRPSCNGYNMDGTVNTSLGADRPGCVDHSARALRRFLYTDSPSVR